MCEESESKAQFASKLKEGQLSSHGKQSALLLLACFFQVPTAQPSCQSNKTKSVVGAIDSRGVRCAEVWLGQGEDPTEYPCRLGC